MSKPKTNEIVENAITYLGEHELAGNSGFVNPLFEAEMKEEGWQKGWSWCCLFTKVVFKNVYPERAAELDKLFSPSCVKTYQNFKEAGHPISELPQVGYLVLWQSMKDGKPQATGHAGIVTHLRSSWEFDSIEGNTSEAGSREGVVVAINHRKTIKDVWEGIKIIGFVSI